MTTPQTTSKTRRAERLNHWPWWVWPGVLLLALGWRAVLLASGAVSFHSDEAIVGLMAHHILQGHPLPTFFYGQAYMGSLDALLVALSFRLFGESILSIRLIQSALYLGTVGTTMILAYRVSHSRPVAVAAGLLVALPPTVLALYTTISLGGYGETLLIGSLLLILAYDLSQALRTWQNSGQAKNGWQLVAIGGLLGLGWWTNSLIVAYTLPIALLLIPHVRTLFQQRNYWPALALAIPAFLLGSAPWWLYNLQHDWESIRFLIGGFQTIGQDSAAKAVSIGDKLFGLVLLGLPAVMGVRFSWATGSWAGFWAIPVIVLYGVLILASLWNQRIRFLLAMLGGFALIFVMSSFGVDSTGRYLLPLCVPFAVVAALQGLRFPLRLGWIALGLLLITNVAGTVLAMRSVPPGLTPQFDPATDFPNDSDQAIIDFLKQPGNEYGYATYWVTYRLAFLSGESITLTPALPYKSTLVFTAADRYPAYTAQVDAAKQPPVFVTANLAQLDAVIARQLDAQGVGYSQKRIGPYTVFYALSRRVSPQSLGLQDLK